MAPRISLKADVLFNQTQQAAAAIAAEANWPATAPAAVDLTTDAGALNTGITAVAAAQAALQWQRQQLRAVIDAARTNMKKVDEATDLLYGADGAQKAHFGLSPKKTTRTPSGPPEQVVVRDIRDGSEPASLFVDFESVESASYQAQWFTDAALTAQVGDLAVTASELTATGLTAGQQYWFRIRAVRGGLNGPWSDPATRVANI